jgi:hypothetical protein
MKHIFPIFFFFTYELLKFTSTMLIHDEETLFSFTYGLLRFTSNMLIHDEETLFSFTYGLLKFTSTMLIHDEETLFSFTYGLLSVMMRHRGDSTPSRDVSRQLYASEAMEREPCDTGMHVVRRMVGWTHVVYDW